MPGPIVQDQAQSTIVDILQIHHSEPLPSSTSTSSILQILIFFFPQQISLSAICALWRSCWPLQPFNWPRVLSDPLVSLVESETGTSTHWHPKKISQKSSSVIQKNKDECSPNNPQTADLSLQAPLLPNYKMTNSVACQRRPFNKFLEF